MKTVYPSKKLEKKVAVNKAGEPIGYVKYILNEDVDSKYRRAWLSGFSKAKVVDGFKQTYDALAKDKEFYLLGPAAFGLRRVSDVITEDDTSDGDGGDLPPTIGLDHVDRRDDPFEIDFDYDSNDEKRNKTENRSRRKGKPSTPISDLPSDSYLSGGGKNSANGKNKNGGSKIDVILGIGGSSSNLSFTENDGADLYKTSLFTQQGRFFSNEKFANNLLILELMEDLYNDYLNHFFYKINFGSMKAISKDELFKYLNTVITALQICLNFKSIYSYSTVPGNLNAGLTGLSRYMTSESIYQLNRLELALRNNILPPRLVLFIEFMYKNYSFSSDKAGTLCRINFEDCFTLNSKKSIESGEYLYEAVEDLLSINERIRSVLFKTFPEWLVNVPRMDGSVEYSEEFLAFWHNSCISENVLPGKLNFSRVVDSVDSVLHYGSISGDVSPLIYACSSVVYRNPNDVGSYFNYNVENKGDVLHTGFWKPYTNFIANANSNTNNISLMCYRGKNLVGTCIDEERYASEVYCTWHSVSTDITALLKDSIPFARYKVASYSSIRFLKDSVTFSFKALFSPKQ